MHIRLPSVFSFARKAAGFTMIELLIVITILGILAVAVLSAINPLEQIARGRDTANMSDAEQLLNATERFVAFQQYYPWFMDADAQAAQAAAVLVSNANDGETPRIVSDDVTNGWFAADVNGAATTCSVLDRLGQGNGAACTGTNEVKESYVNKVSNLPADRALRVFKLDNETSTNMYVCFPPQSDAFRQQAITRCGTATTNSIPSDLTDAYTAVCGGCTAGGTGGCLYCIP